MTLTKMQAMLGVATGILLLGGAIGERAIVLERRFAALDTRLGKLESAIRTMNVTTPDERYRQLVKELIAEERNAKAPELASLPVVHCPKGYEVEYTNHADPNQPLIGGCISQNLVAPHGFDKGIFPADAGAAADMPSTKPPQ